MSSKTISIFLFLIINAKLIKTKLSDDFLYGNFSDSGDIINITDYYNLSLLVSTSKNIYIGFPPTLKRTITSTITNFSSGVTINENYLLMSCLDGKILTKININTGEETDLCPSLSFSSPPQKICSISSYNNKVFLVYTILDNEVLIPNIIEFTINNLDNPICENYDTSKKLPFLEPISFDKLISCEIISPEDENNFYLVCFYVKKEIIEDKTVYNIYGYVEQKEYTIFSSSIETDINVLKIDSNNLRCISKNYIIDVHIKNENGEIIIFKNAQSGKSNDYGLYSYNNGFIFASSSSILKIYKYSYSHYYQFKKSSNIIIKILGIYNQINNYLLLYYQSDTSIYYISLKNCTKYFDIKINSYYSYFMKSETSYDFDVSKFISPKDDYGIFENTNIIIEGSFVLGCCEFSESSQILQMYVYPSMSRDVIYSFKLSSYSKGFTINLITDSTLKVVFSFGDCLYSCDACFYNYGTCDIGSCRKEYSFFRGMNETNNTNCGPKNQTFRNYIYNNETNYFEKCFHTCLFCSLMNSSSSESQHNCLACFDGYQKSYEYLGNCYKNDINDNSDKIISEKGDESFTSVSSCQETLKKYKINSTGECVSECPSISLYKKYTFQYVDFFNYDFDPSIPQYILEDEEFPKYLLGNLCLEKCPLGTELNDDNNECICKDSSLQDEETKLICKNCRTINKRFYLHDIKQCVKDGCPNDYYQFNFDCYIDGCPSNTYEISNKKCKSKLNYCFININFETVCNNKPINEYIFNYNNTNQYLKSCEESVIYTINKAKTYLYNNTCYLSCPDNTQADETKMICECKYKYFLNKDFSLENNNYICFSEQEKCKKYIPVIDIGICVNSINDCIELGYKIFYNECSQECPIDSELKDGKCFCLYSFYNDSKSFHCFSSEETCESKDYIYNSPQTKECFTSIDDCISKGYIYTYMNYCYKDGCPENTEVDEVASNSNHKICFNKSPYFRNDIQNFTDFCTISDLKDNSCKINYKVGNDLTNISNNLETIIYDDNLLGNESTVISGNYIDYEITTSDIDIEQRNNYNISYIDFGECENTLKNYYKIDNLLIFKYEVYINKSFPLKVEYKVYHPKTKEQLDLSICNDNKILISAPLILDNNSLDLYNDFSGKGIDIFDKNDRFYQDVCKTFTTNVSTDIILSDRKKEYYQVNLFLCDDGCEYKNYDIKNKFVKCNCGIKYHFTDKIEIIDFNFEKDDLSSFFRIKTYANFACIKCYYLLFSKEGFAYNIGNYLILIILLFFILLMILFFSKFESNVKKLISQIITRVNKSLNNDIVRTRNNINLNKNNKIVKKKKKKISNEIIENKNIIKNSSSKENISLSKLLKNKSKDNDNNIINRDNNKEIILKTNNDDYCNEKDFLNDEELNNLEYEKAKIIDKRNFSQYYLSLLKKKHLLLFSFIPMNDYNLMHIKICLFLYIFSVYFSINTLFFTDVTMHKIYKDKGVYNLLYQLPKILYSTIISSIMNLLIKFLALSEKNILMLKQSKTKEELNQKEIQTLSCLKLKFILFYLFGTIFLIIFWYYVSVFCAVYKNTQIILIEDTLFSFLFSLLYPFALNLIPSFIRILSIKNKNSSSLYKASILISLI